MKKWLVLALFVVTCSGKAAPTAPGPETFCPAEFSFSFREEATLFTQVADSIVYNDYRLTLFPDSTLEGTGRFTVRFKETVKEQRRYATYNVLMPFVAYWREQQGAIYVLHTNVWLAREGVVSRRIASGLVTEHNAETVQLRLLWKRC